MLSSESTWALMSQITRVSGEERAPGLEPSPVSTRTASSPYLAASTNSAWVSSAMMPSDTQ